MNGLIRSLSVYDVLSTCKNPGFDATVNITNFCTNGFNVLSVCSLEENSPKIMCDCTNPNPDSVIILEPDCSWSEFIDDSVSTTTESILTTTEENLTTK